MKYSGLCIQPRDKLDNPHHTTWQVNKMILKCFIQTFFFEVSHECRVAGHGYVWYLFAYTLTCKHLKLSGLFEVLKQGNLASTLSNCYSNVQLDLNLTWSFLFQFILHSSFAAFINSCGKRISHSLPYSFFLEELHFSFN